ADHPLTDTMVREIRGVLSLAPDAGDEEGWQVPIVTTNATKAEGIEELGDQLAAHHEHIARVGTLEQRRRRNLMNEVLELATVRLRRRLRESVGEDEEVQRLLDEVVARRLDPASAAGSILERTTE